MTMAQESALPTAAPANGAPPDGKQESPVPLWKRPDLKVQRVFSQGEPGWSIKDPVSLAYFRLREPEFAVLQLLDGSRTCGDLVSALGQRFPWDEWDHETILGFLHHLEASGLAVTRHVGTGLRTARRTAAGRRNRILASFTGILAIRFRGIDPQPMLQRIYPLVSWLFSALTQRVLLVLVAVASLLLLLRLDNVVQRLPHLQAFIAPQNLVSLLIAIAVIKLLHELGHALTCCHYGGECHELGVLLLVFLPVLYCDVSDAWMLPERRSRILISAAGIIVELVLASIFALLWWWSLPGWFNAFCLNVIVVCSVNTLLFNGNPLLKYDGYYVLSDLVAIPNLRSQSRAAVQSQFDRQILGVDSDDASPVTRQDWFLLVYGVASIIYQCLVIFAILWFVSEALEAWHLSILSRVLAVPVLMGVIVLPLLGTAVRTRMHLKNQTVNGRRAALGLLGLAGALVAALTVPLPNTVKAPFTIRPADALAVYVAVPGTLESALPPGTSVTQGQVLGRLRNLSLRRERERRAARAEELQLELENLKSQRQSDSRTSHKIPATVDELQSAQEQLARVDRELAKLTITSPGNGLVIAPPNLPDRSGVTTQFDDVETPQWSGTPLTPSNLGAALQPRTLFCYVGEPEQVEASLVVDQSQVEFASVGQSVELQLQSAPGRLLYGKVTEISRAETKNMPREILIAGLAPLPASPESGSENQQRIAYQIRVRIDAPQSDISLYSPGTARIDCGWKPVFDQLWRSFRQTFSTL
jgi:putative peptide zinc metalloprotease protein